MTVLHMQIEQVQQTLQVFRQVVRTMESLVERLTSSAPLGWWQGPAADEYEQRLRLLIARYRSLMEDFESLMQALEAEVRQWQEAARQLEGATLGAGVVGTGTGIVTPGGTVPDSGPSSHPPDTSAEKDSDVSDQTTTDASQAPGEEATPEPRSTYTPRFDGTKPAPGMDSTYGKPGQLPLDAVVKSTPDNRDPNLYADVINQFAVGNNPRYEPIIRPGPNNDITFCNTFAGDVARAMGHPFPTKAEWGLNPRDRATIGMPDLWRYFTDSNAPIRAADQGWKEIPVTNLQELERYVNSGKMAVVVTPDHIAVVRPNQRITDLASIRIAQAGAINANDIPLVQGFGKKRLGMIRIFVHD